MPNMHRGAGAAKHGRAEPGRAGGAAWQGQSRAAARECLGSMPLVLGGEATSLAAAAGVEELMRSVVSARGVARSRAVAGSTQQPAGLPWAAWGKKAHKRDKQP